jgi:hypothetical protein
MTDEAMSPLRRRMIEDMTIRKFAPKTQHDYVQRVKNFAAFLRRSPDTAGLAAGPVASVFSAWPRLRDEATFTLLAGIGALVYGGAVTALFGPQWLAAWRRRARPTAAQ